jgi:diguanylate cyclase (GGDEF)-like protein
MSGTVQAEEFQRRARTLERQESQVWLTALLFMLAMMVALAAVTPRVRGNQLPFISLGLIAFTLPVAIGLRKKRQALAAARQELIRAAVSTDGVQDFGLLDSSTGLLNRRYLDSHAQKELGVAERLGIKLTFLMIRLHASESHKLLPRPSAGDTSVIAVADFLRSNFRNSDTLIRCGERDFLVLMLACNEIRAREVAERLLAKAADWNRDKPADRCEMSLLYATVPYIPGEEIKSVLAKLNDDLESQQIC